MSDPFPVCLLTDFGETDPYVGLMKSVLQSEPPYPPVIDLTHDVPPQDEQTAAFLLDYALDDCPEGAVILLVVDPGVGTQRDILAVRTEGNRIVVAPDTGMVDGLDWSRAHRVTNEELARSTVSSTFHGRDWFAPVGRFLSLGGTLADVGPQKDHPGSEGLVPKPVPEEECLRGEIVHVDRFGNLISNIQPGQLRETLRVQTGDFPDLRLEIKDRVLPGIASTYGRADGLTGVVGSFERVEVAMPGGSARDELEASRGDNLRIYPDKHD